MGDIAEDWREFREHKRRRNREAGDRNMASADPTGWTQHTEYHWSRTYQGDRLDFWPSTMTFRFRGETHHGNANDFINAARDAGLREG
ncbi:hypothetical protein ACTZWW_04430 [Salinarimonas sp. NSM]|uniref:hypothetical protein n=1 Tax=Salinarimonas sp. NSM TaxID=3458003 RepID=UPI004035E3E1